MERWQGRVALVTGASAGIGAELCRALVPHGMTVVGCARSVGKIRAIAEEDAMKASQGKLVGVECDLTKESDILSMFDEIRRTFGRLDVCINNAGIGYECSLLTGSTSYFRNMLDVNVMGMCICTQQAVKLMQEKEIDDGQIINISSLTSFQVPGTRWMGLYFYSGTKFMVRALTDGLRRELRDINSHIKVASISPGVVQTQFFDTYYKDNANFRAEELFKSQNLQPKDISDAVLYILSTPQYVEVHDIAMCPFGELLNKTM